MAGGFLLAVPLAPLVVLAIAERPTLWGAAYLASLLAIAGGALTAPWRIARARGITRGGTAALTVFVLARLAVTGDGTTLRAITLPEGGRGRLVNRLVEEQDVSLLAGRLLQWTGGIRASEVDEFLPKLRGIYGEMRAAEGATPTPFVATYLGLQSADAFDTIVIEPDGEPRGAVIFLHGFAGNFSELCWQFAQAAREANLVTVCPSVSWVGDWWRRQGADTVRATLRWVRETRSLDRVYLAGLSNGGVGAHELAPQFAGDLQGLLLISGASSSSQTSKLPVFVLASDGDSRMPVRTLRGVADEAGARGTYLELKGGHFVFAEQAETCRRAIADWLLTH